MAAAQSAEWNSFWEKVISRFQVALSNAPLDTAGAASRTYQTAIKTHKAVVDLAAKQRQGFALSGVLGANSYSKYANSLSAGVKKSFEQSLQAQKQSLRSSADQDKAILQAMPKTKHGNN